MDRRVYLYLIGVLVLVLFVGVIPLSVPQQDPVQTFQAQSPSGIQDALDLLYFGSYTKCKARYDLLPVGIVFDWQDCHREFLGDFYPLIFND